MPRASYIVVLDLPDGADAKDGAEYIGDAVKGFSGSLSPREDPFYHLDVDQVEVLPLGVVPD